MAYILYINGNQIDIEPKAISQTRQVNDLARLDNRQSSITNKFTARMTPNNVRAMQHVYLVGNQSNIPYQKNEASLFDAESGECLIYKGWANVVQSGRKGYEISISDGLVDFYRRIENHTLTECNIAELNHSKTLQNIINSWQNNLPYMYAIADYNGKNKFITTPPNPINIEINTDFQVPSARVSYLWEKVHLYAGFTFSGAYFQTQDFLNWFMSFPKPVPTLVPHKVLIHAGECYPRHSTYWYFNENNAYLSSENYLLSLPRENFTTPQAEVTNDMQTTNITAGGYVYNQNPIHILQNGTYSIDAYSPYTDFNYLRKDVNGNIMESGQAEIGPFSPNGYYKTHIFNCIAGDTIYLMMNIPNVETVGTPTFDWELNLIDGYEANFEEAFMEFQITDFVKEVMVHGGLTAFKDKNSDHIEYLTMKEILQSNDVVDWSKKYQYKDIEKYKIGNYAKRNFFKYRYNTENELHNDGYIEISDENLQDEVTVFNSKIYTPERRTLLMAGQNVNTFKIWEKELKEDSSIEYKDLSGRFYFLRFQMASVSTTIASETLNQQQAVTQVAVASYLNLSWNEIIINNYPTIKSILDKAKVIDGYFYLTPKDVANFNFKSPIYIEQLGSYYYINKIMNFVKGKVTKCEMFEVDYNKVIQLPQSATYITIDSFTVTGCEVVVNYSTDAPINTNITLVCALNNFGLPVFTPPDPIYGHEEVIQNSAVQNTFSFTLNAGAFYTLVLSITNPITGTISSNIVYFENTAGCIVSSPSTLTITNATLLSQTALDDVYEITFTTDAVLPRTVYVQNYKTPVLIDPNNPYGGSFGGWSGYTDNGVATTTTIQHTVSRIFGDPTKLQIKIGTKESNIYNI